MSKLRKIIFGVFLLLSCGLAYMGYRYLKNVKQPSLKAFTLLPDSCSLLLTFENYPEFSNSLRNQSLVWQDLRVISSLKHFDRYLVYFDSLMNSDKDFKELVTDNPVFFATYPENKFLVTLNLKELADEKVFTGKTSALLKNPVLFVKIRDGVFAISNDAGILEDVFNVSGAKVYTNKNFSGLKDKTNYHGTSVYINTEGLLSKSFSSVSIKPESIAFNGIAFPDSSRFEGDFTSNPLNKPDLLGNVPLVTNAFEIFTINNAEKIFSRNTTSDWWQPVNNAALFNAKKQFYENISQYVITISLASKNKSLLIHVADSSKVAEILPFMQDTLLRSGNILKLQHNKYSFSKSTFPGLKLPELNFVVAFNDHIVFTQTAADAEIFVNAKRNNSSILQNSDFQNYTSKNFDVDFHYLSYATANALSRQELPFGNWLKNEDLAHLKNIGHCSLLKLYKNGVINHRFHVKYFQENVLDEPNVLWTFQADSTIGTKAFLFKNHITGGNEIAFQTDNNDLYLVNATGKQEWKKHLSEKIRSEIFTIDAFKNGKYQLLFNTDNFIHMLDRNGNYVQGYPVKLPARATNHLCVFDYENKNDLRLFIACANNRIFNYTIWGLQNEGYKPLVTTEHVVLPIRYCKVGLSDYLITADKKGKIYAFSRKGEGRIDFKNKLVENVSDFELEKGSSISNTQLIYYDDKNNLIDKISLADKKELSTTTGNENKCIYGYLDFDKNKIIDVVLAMEGKIEVFDIAGNKIFSRDDPGLKTPFRLSTATVGNSSYVCAYDSLNAKSYIFSETLPAKNFAATELPLPCTLFNDGKPYALVISGKQIKCYKL